MRTALAAFLVFMQSVSGFSQTIVDLFLAVPDTSVLGLTRRERERIVQHSSGKEAAAPGTLGRNGLAYAFETLDVRNGYLRLIGAIEGHLQMCYWNQPDGRKLVAVYLEGCGPACYVEQLHFYRFDQGKWTPVDFRNVLPELIAGFYSPKAGLPLPKTGRADPFDGLLFSLPRTGRNITVKRGPTELREGYEKHALGNRMELVWQQGRFTRGKVYWQ